MKTRLTMIYESDIPDDMKEELIKAVKERDDKFLWDAFEIGCQFPFGYKYPKNVLIEFEE